MSINYKKKDFMNKIFGSLLIIAAFLAGFLVYRVTQYQVPYTTTTCSKQALDLKMAMRKLWEDHMIWTHAYIVSEIANLEDLDAVTKRLLQNQVDLGNAIKPIYGNDPGNKLAELLKEHILLASEVVKAAKVNDKEKLDATNKKWYQNADDIAAFLSSANPNWPQEVLKDMLHKHLDYVAGQAVSRLGKKWQEDINFYDTNHNHMLMLSDALSDGIIKQFPTKF